MLKSRSLHEPRVSSNLDSKYNQIATIQNRIIHQTWTICLQGKRGLPFHLPPSLPPLSRAVQLMVQVVNYRPEPKEFSEYVEQDASNNQTLGVNLFLKQHITSHNGRWWSIYQCFSGCDQRRNRIGGSICPQHTVPEQPSNKERGLSRKETRLIREIPPMLLISANLISLFWMWTGDHPSWGNSAGEEIHRALNH